MTFEKHVGIICDHAGFSRVGLIKEWLLDHFFTFEVFGANSEISVDYTDFVPEFVQYVRNSVKNCGVMLCGSGVGMSIAANRFNGIRAALCYVPDVAYFARTHNNANVLAMGTRLMSCDDMIECLKIFLNTPFSNETRHVRRNLALDALKIL